MRLRSVILSSPSLPFCLLCVSVPLWFNSHSFAAEPVARSVNVRGLQVGGTTTLVIDGDEFGKEPRLLLPFPAQQQLKKGSTDKQATFDVTLGELRRLQDGIEREEVERVQAGLKSSLIMQEESTSARAGTLASDWYYLGRVRGTQEVHDAVEALTPRRILAYLRRCPPRDFSIVTLGPKPLRLKPAARRTHRQCKQHHLSEGTGFR